MTAHKEGDTTVVDTDEARAGKTGVGLRYVLAISLIIVVGGMLFVLMWQSGAFRLLNRP